MMNVLGGHDTKPLLSCGYKPASRVQLLRWRLVVHQCDRTAVFKAKHRTKYIGHIGKVEP